jgi:hypothetical protein
MTIRATMFQTSMEIKISGRSQEEFDADLDAFKEAVSPADREWLPSKGVWLLRHPAKYIHLRFVQIAMDDRKRQSSLL